jgi:hypothetical protein
MKHIKIEYRVIGEVYEGLTSLTVPITEFQNAPNLRARINNLVQADYKRRRFDFNRGCTRWELVDLDFYKEVERILSEV